MSVSFSKSTRPPRASATNQWRLNDGHPPEVMDQKIFCSNKTDLDRKLFPSFFVYKFKFKASMEVVEADTIV